MSAHIVGVCVCVVCICVCVCVLHREEILNLSAKITDLQNHLEQERKLRLVQGNSQVTHLNLILIEFKCHFKER